MNKRPNVFLSFGGKRRIKHGFRHFNHKLILQLNARNIIVHRVNLVRIQSERITTINKRIRVHRLLIRLAKQILPALGIRNMLVNSENDIVRGQAFRGGKKAHIPKNNPSLVLAKNGGTLPLFNIFLHIHLFRRPVVRDARLVVRPSPLILHRKNLIRVCYATVQNLFFFLHISSFKIPKVTYYHNSLQHYKNLS